MLTIVSTTGVCNLHCRYCGGTISEAVMPHEVQYDVAALRDWVAADDDATVAFYGGEPMLRIPWMQRVMDEVPAKRWVVQTNGTLLSRLSDEMVARLDTILVSLDGRPEVTDANRGKGLYERVMGEVTPLRPRFHGDLVARMAVSEECDIHADVHHLLQQGFDHVHWQLNAIWSPDDSWTDFPAWMEDSYLPGLDRLFDDWMAALETGQVLGIVPFQGMLRRQRKGLTGLPCGAGDTAFAVATDGRILACPIAGDYDWNQVSRLGEDTSDTLRGSVRIEGKCLSCDALDLCGGRCLFHNREGHWDPEEADLACRAARHLACRVRAAAPRIEELVAAGVVDEAELDYPLFNNTTEIVP